MGPTKSGCAIIWIFVISTTFLLHTEKACHIFCANCKKKGKRRLNKSRLLPRLGCSTKFLAKDLPPKSCRRLFSSLLASLLRSDHAITLNYHHKRAKNNCFRALERPFCRQNCGCKETNAPSVRSQLLSRRFPCQLP